MQLRCEIDCVPLTSPFVIARESITTAALVRVTLQDGASSGVGEGAPQAYQGESIEQLRGEFEAVRPRLQSGFDHDQLREILGPGALRNAIDCALWDLEAKRSGRRAWQLLGIDDLRPYPTSMSIGIADPEEMAARARELAEFKILKLKLDRFRVIDRVRAVREAVPSARLVVDVNGGWSLEDLEANAPRLREFGVEVIEQPLPADGDHALVEYRGPLPLIADESCRDRSDLDYLRQRYQYINIKLDKCGGLTEGLALAEAAARCGMGIMVGCMICSSLGNAPALVLAQRAAYADLDGQLFLSSDRVPPLRCSGGLIHAPDPALWG